MADQLEEGYLRVRPWRNAPLRSAPDQADLKTVTESSPLETQNESLDGADLTTRSDQVTPAKFELLTQRLFGAHMNSVVTFVDAETAWILSDDLLSRMSSTVYQRFAGGGHLGGMKVVRGWREPIKQKAADKGKASKDDKLPQTAKQSEKETSANEEETREGTSEPDAVEPEPTLRKLERQMSNFVTSPTEDTAMMEAEARQRDEDEIKDSYVLADGEDQGREIEHLLLVVSAPQQYQDAIALNSSTDTCSDSWHRSTSRSSFGVHQLHWGCQLATENPESCVRCVS